MVTEQEFETRLEESISKIKDKHPEYAVFLDNIRYRHLDWVDEVISLSMVLPFGVKRTLSFEEFESTYWANIPGLWGDALTATLDRMCWLTKDCLIDETLKQLIADGKGYSDHRTYAGDKIILCEKIPEDVVIMNHKSYLKYAKPEYDNNL